MDNEIRRPGSLRKAGVNLERPVIDDCGLTMMEI